MNSDQSFLKRHIGITSEDLSEMLQTIDANSLDELIQQTIPASIRTEGPLKIGEAISESELAEKMQKLADQNLVCKNYIGLGYHETQTPPVILRSILCNPGWYTAYTPYQAEISQGRLEALLNFQTAVTDLTGMEMANASLLDEATAAAEAMTLARRIAQKKKNQGKRFFVDEGVFETSLSVIQTRAEPLGIEVVTGDWRKTEPDSDFFGVCVQSPNRFGKLEDFSEFFARAKKLGIECIAGADLLSLALVKSPGEMGADICYGTSQRFGVPLGFGGPHAAFLAGKSEWAREMPGRIIGVSTDRDGNIAYRMALQTREQHIRRAKATSNICTAQALLAIMAGMYACYHGPQGLHEIASRIHSQTRRLAQTLESESLKICESDFFDTLCFEVDENQKSSILQRARQQNVNLNHFYPGKILVNLHEKTTEEDLEELAEILTGKKGKLLPNDSKQTLAPALQRTSPYLTHPVFHSYQTETELMRYIRELEKKDLSLCDAMIPLGSCTMKLNPAASLLPLTLPGFSNIHPFVPVEQVPGYLAMIDELDRDLSEITGFDKISFQPNSGAQGEYAGLMTIRSYLKSIGQGHRDVVLICVSAHGTNPASSSMAGMTIVTVKSDAEGNMDFEDFSEKVEKNSDKLAGLMVTYPSTHGVFEEKISEVCEIIHRHGGQVYMDGANMNAQVGLTNPGIIGADVCHLNLHKTFSIPHGGGGPGMGPIGVKKHLIPHLPGHLFQTGGFSENSGGAVAGAPFGSASILTISYAYIRLLGSKGLTEATRYGILNANYIKSRLEKFFPPVYQGTQGRVAHEVILDIRDRKKDTEIEATDVAKRLMDYGFHAPTLSFPIANTLMIEPTESESKREIDRFCEAMIQIHEEIEEIKTGQAKKGNNLLSNAPHPLQEATKDDWQYTYTRQKAVYPVPGLKKRKFWPSISRIDDVIGDRNLICTRQPIESCND